MASPLANAIEFFKNFGLFDVVLPFLLIFTIVFAILEKTRILGVDKEKDKETPKKNLNSMVAFVVALLVVATNKVVTALNFAIPNIILLLMVSICFLLLIGVFSGTGEMKFSEIHKRWYQFFVVLMFIGVVLIFLASIQLDNGQSWLEFGWNYIINRWEGSVVASFLFLAIIFGAIFYIVYSPSSEEGGKK